MKIRRALPILLLFAAALPATAAPRQLACSPGTQAATQSGPVCGATTAVAGGNVVHYLGIPYAAPPTATDPQSCLGARPAAACRWQKPQNPVAWTALRSATSFGAACAQPDPVTGELLAGSAEDCLFLNVYKPVGAASRPVMVYIHGGAFFEGSASTALFDGGALAASGNVVVVDFNYRLGALGFLVAPDANAANSLAGNYGFFDQQFALQWVRRNIAAFGGDPARVTIFGQSAGAMSVGLHLVSAPASAGLFHAGIMESNPLGIPFQTLVQASATGATFADNLNCRANDVKCLYQQSTSSLIANQASTPGLPPTQGLLWAPVLDGTNLRLQPVSALATNLDLPLIFGTNSGEGVFFANLVPFPIPRSAWGTFLANLFPAAIAARVAGQYPCIGTNDCRTRLGGLLTDFEFTCANRRAARRGNVVPVYAYQFQAVSGFDWPANAGCPANCPCKTAVCHSAELPYVFGTPGQLDYCGAAGNQACSFDAAQGRLSKDLMRYWTSFATDRKPSGPVVWPLFDRYLLFSTVATAPPIAPSVADPFEATCTFWNSTGLYDPPSADETSVALPAGASPKMGS